MREWFDVMQDRLVKNIGAMNRLASCRSLQHFLAVQSSAGVDACVRDFHQRVKTLHADPGSMFRAD